MVKIGESIEMHNLNIIKQATEISSKCILIIAGKRYTKRVSPRNTIRNNCFIIPSNYYKVEPVGLIHTNSTFYNFINFNHLICFYTTINPSR